MAHASCNNLRLTAVQRGKKVAVLHKRLKGIAGQNNRMEAKMKRMNDTPVGILKELKKVRKAGPAEEICARLWEKSFKSLITSQHVNLLAMVNDSVKHIGVKPKGRRYSDQSKNLAGAMTVKYGSGCPRHMAVNLLGPSESTIRRWLPKLEYKGGYDDTFVIVKQAARMYTRLMQKLGLRRGSIAALLGEDETRIRQEACYDERTDTILGLCGPKGGGEEVGILRACRCSLTLLAHFSQADGADAGEHECILDGSVHIGVGGTEGYQKIYDAMKDNVVASMGRVMMYIPLNRDLPAIVVLLACTCNRFKAEPYVSEQWKMVAAICNKVLGPVVGRVIGHASDGDGRRRKLMMMKMAVSKQLRQQPEFQKSLFYPPNCAG